MSSVTTFEIFHDIDRGKFPTESVEAAITYIGEIIGEHTILSNRSVRLSSNPSSEYIDMEKIRWPRFSADVNIVLTDRALDKPPEGSDVALLDLTRRITTGVSNPLSKVAVIDTLRTTAEAATVTHEIGHLFNLKLKGITKSTQSPHCALNYCVMHESLERSYTRKEVTIAPTFLERIGVVKKQRHSSTEAHNPVIVFCEECTQQLGSTALLRNLAKSGRHVPDFLL